MVLRQFLTQFGAKYIHDALVQSPTFHRIVQRTHDTIKGIPQQQHHHRHRHGTGGRELKGYKSAPGLAEEETVGEKVGRFATHFRDEFVDNFTKKRR